MLTVENRTITIDTRTLTARIEDGFLTSLKAKATGEELVTPERSGGSALQLAYPGEGNVDVVGGPASEITVRQLSERAAQVRLHGWDADGVIVVSDDPETGDLVVEPSAYSSRAGVLSCRWLLPAARDDLDLVAPFFQGVKLKPDDPLIQQRWAWPMFWEAGLAILQGANGGFWIHCRDNAYRYKALDIAGGRLTLETEAYGPISRSLGAGGLEWRINVHQGDWTVPAGIYRDWLWHAYGLHEAERARLPWTRDVRFAVSWFGGDPAILNALAEMLDPKTVLLHYSNWRTDPYDENYPTYSPSPAAVETFRKASQMGFHIMPHCNSVDMDPTHPVYALIRDFQYRDAQSRRLHGWAWDTETGTGLGVPNSYSNLMENRHRKVMVKVHPGLGMWRAVLAEEIQSAVRAVGTGAVFIDVTLCTGNLDNCLVENTTSSEGMKLLIDRIAGLEGGLSVGGEGLNEITMQGLSFAQAHLFKSWQSSIDGLERTGGCPLGHFLFGRLCRTFGYSRLSGRTEDEALRMRIHEQLGAIPTVTVRNADEIRDPNPAVKRALELARG